MSTIPVFLLISCKKSATTPPPPPNPVEYNSIQAGNTWEYELVNNPSTAPATSTYTLTCTAADTSIGTRSYRIFTRTDALAKEYYFVLNSEYFEYLTLPILDGFKFENLYLKSNVVAGATWTQTLPPVTYAGITATISKQDTVKQTGMSMTVKGKTYNNVIHVSSGLKLVSLSLPIPGVSLVSSIQNYYAPGVGRIRATYDIRFSVPPPFSITQTFENKTELISTNF
ncbi:MAG TPA: hypothetical protein PKC39_12465 [Ferruginibacter sp.]|nr:hypothetical protein [Ferruginibacter sp.]HMP21764.1 hypothetical protein [Ferruginibacter sp.]